MVGPMAYIVPLAYAFLSPTAYTAFWGRETPLPLQQQAVMSIVAGRDALIQSHCGGGKTAAFLIAILQRVDTSVTLGSQALVLSPTRELAQATGRVLEIVGSFMHCRVFSLVGGTSAPSFAALRAGGFHVVVGTPGRTMDALQRGVFRTDHLRMVVLDEVDEILERGFDELVSELFEALPPGVQVRKGVA
jgi:superfamily II DNA/RNA helicase